MPDLYDGWTSQQTPPPGGGTGDPQDQYAHWVAHQKPTSVSDSDQFAKWQASQHPPPPAHDHPGNIDLRQPTGIPRVTADDTRVAHLGAAPHDTGLLSRVVGGVSDLATDLVHHPSHLVTQPLAALGRTFLVPVKGEAVGDVAQGQAANAGLLGTPGGVPMEPGATRPTGQTPQEFHRAALETVANVGAGAVGGELGGRLAPLVGKVAGEVVGRTAANAAAGAVLNPTDPLVGAATNVATGEALHHTVPPILRRTLTGTELGDETVATPELRERARQYAYDNLRGNAYQNSETGTPIQVNRRGIDHTLRHAQDDVMGRIHAQSIPALDQLLEDATFVGSEPPKGGATAGTRAVHRFEKPVTIAGNDYTAQLVVKEASDGHFFYDHRLTTIEPDESTGVPNHQSQDGGVTSDASGSTPVSIPPGPEERNLGPLSTTARQTIVQGGRELLTDPNAGLIAQGGPKAVVAQHIAAANAAHQLPVYAKQQAAAALEGLTDEQKQRFDARIVQDNLEAEASRKSESAPDVADRAAQAASAIRTQLPQEDIAQAPWFQRALQNAKQRVLPVTEGMAPEAGVAPESFRKPSLGLYAPLIGNLEDESPTAPTQAPLYRRPTTRTSGSANPFTGTAAQYAVGDYPSRVAADAQSKAVNAAKNRVLAGVANTGREIGNRTEADPATERVFAFNNKNEIVNVPLRGSDPGLRMFAVPNDVADAVDRYNARSGPPGMAMKFLKAGSTAATKAVLLNPLVAPFHALREAGSLGTVGSGNLMKDVLMSLPFAKSTTVLAKAAALDPTDPAFIEADRKAVLAGAARVDESKGGLLSKGHEWLFGAPGKTEKGIPTGMDRRIRALATMQFTEDRAAKGLSTEGPEYDHALRSFVNDHVGEYVAKNRGEIVQAIKGIAPFAPMHIAGAVTGAKSLVGESGLSDPTITQKIGTALRGPAGAIATTALATKLVSGRSAIENGRDRETAVGLPLYNVPGKTMPQFFYGSGADAVKKFGPGTKAISLRDPGQSVVARMLSPLLYSDRGDKAGEVFRQGKNFGASFAGPGLAFGLTTAGYPTYFGANDKIQTDNTPTLSLTEKATHRIGQAIANATAAGALTGSGSGGGRSLSQALLPPLTEGSPTSKQADFRAKFYDFQDAVKSSLSRTADPHEQQQIIKDAGDQMAAHGMQREAFEGQLQRFVAKHNDPSYRQGQAERFHDLYGGPAR